MSLESATSALKTKIAGRELINAKVKFDLGADGIILVDGTTSPPVVTHDNDAADVTLVMSSEHFMDLLDGELNPQMAFMTGKLKIDGNMGLAMQLAQIFS